MRLTYEPRGVDTAVTLVETPYGQPEAHGSNELRLRLATDHGRYALVLSLDEARELHDQIAAQLATQAQRQQCWLAAQVYIYVTDDLCGWLDVYIGPFAGAYCARAWADMAYTDLDIARLCEGNKLDRALWEISDKPLHADQLRSGALTFEPVPPERLTAESLTMALVWTMHAMGVPPQKTA